MADAMTATASTPPQSAASPGGFEWKFLNGGWAGDEVFDPAVDGECTLTTGEFTNRFIMVEGTERHCPRSVYCFNTCNVPATSPLVSTLPRSTAP